MYNEDDLKQFTTGSEENRESLRFVAVGNRVHDNLRRLVARCKSANFATRVANALNRYKPDRRGQ